MNLSTQLFLSLLSIPGSGGVSYGCPAYHCAVCVNLLEDRAALPEPMQPLPVTTANRSALALGKRPWWPVVGRRR